MPFEIEKLEKEHRRALSAFNRRHLADAVYYRDAKLDPEIETLVEMLNNTWTITTFSCGGHWTSEKFHYPYVCFFVYNQHRQWMKITRQTWKLIASEVSDSATISVSYNFCVPEPHISSMSWYLGPVMRKLKSNAEQLYGNKKLFRKTMNNLIVKLCQALNSTVRAEQSS